MRDNAGADMTAAVVGVIGGSGVYDLPGLENIREERFETPWGALPTLLRFGTIGETRVVFLARHGRGHWFFALGHKLPRNIDALKRAGVTDIVSVFGLRLVQIRTLSRTLRGRGSIRRSHLFARLSFFGNGCVAHVSMAHPVAPKLSERILPPPGAEQIAARQGNHVCIEGRSFPLTPNRLTYKAAGLRRDRHTALPEAKLAREAEISYATIAMVTDFDCCTRTRRPSTWPAVIEVVRAMRRPRADCWRACCAIFPAEHEACPNGFGSRARTMRFLTVPEAGAPALLRKLERGLMGRLNGNSANLISSAAPGAWIFAPDREKCRERFLVIVALQGFVPIKNINRSPAPS